MECNLEWKIKELEREVALLKAALSILKQAHQEGTHHG